MYLEEFRIRNFRAIEHLELDFKKGLNIIIGENNSGKTAVIDALRLCLGDFQQPRDIYCSFSDFRIDSSVRTDKKKDIEFDLVFNCDDIQEIACFNELHVLDKHGNNSLQLHFRYELVDYKLGKKVKRTVWGGAKEGGNVSYEIRSSLRNVYLSALRDTNKALRPIQGNILGDLYSNIRLDEDNEKDREMKDQLLTEVTTVLEKEEWQNFIKKGNKSILDHLDHLFYLTREKKQDVEVTFAPFEFNKLVQKLIFRLPADFNNVLTEDQTKQYFEISQNGLGYNNLIYTATVLGDIKRRKEISDQEYTLLLIEEPEAHLHPQFQKTFFNYLRLLDERNEFQIIVTSHSPTIAAKTDLNLLTILENHENKIYATQIKDINLDEVDLKYLQKFLDVTKSQLFFSNGVILVEGISESLLIPIFSRILGSRYDIERNGIEVVNVNGVAFKHFAKLFNVSEEGKRMECRCAIITDDDKGKKGAAKRIEKIKKLENGNLKCKIGKKTFEYELFINNPENECLNNVFKHLHPTNYEKVNDSSRNLNDRADIFVETISNSSKSEFAYLLTMELEKDENFCRFNIPQYIEEAIKFVVDGI